MSFVLGAADSAPAAADLSQGLWTLPNLIAAAALTLMEVVLGVDNIVFVAIVAGRVPPDQRARVRGLGLLISVGLRCLMLFGLKWILEMKQELFSLLGHGMTMKDLLMLAGGLFLLYSSTKEIHGKLEGEAGGHGGEGATQAMGVAAGKAIVQIAMINLVFSLDSIFTAVGMAKNIWVMVAAVLASSVVMVAASGSIGGFIEKHPTVKMLALSFLLLIGVMLVGEAFHQEIPKGYIYFGMGFSLLVEMLNMKVRGKAKPHAGG
jgi:hypothetical protein